MLVKHGGGVKRLPTITVRHEAEVVGNRSDSELEGDAAEDPSQKAPDVAGAHTRIGLPEASARKRFVVPSADVVPWMLVLKIVMRRAMLLHGKRFT